MSVFRHADGRAMVAEEAGGTGGGSTSVHHRLATLAEEAALLAEEATAKVESLFVAPIAEPPVFAETEAKDA